MTQRRIPESSGLDATLTGDSRNGSITVIENTPVGGNRNGLYLGSFYYPFANAVQTQTTSAPINTKYFSTQLSLESMRSGADGGFLFNNGAGAEIRLGGATTTTTPGIYNRAGLRVGTVSTATTIDTTLTTRAKFVTAEINPPSTAVTGYGNYGSRIFTYYLTPTKVFTVYATIATQNGGLPTAQLSEFSVTLTASGLSFQTTGYVR